jgi:predicted RNA binding protein YcfA (HicA-like mRNA interferase family)
MNLSRKEAQKAQNQKILCLFAAIPQSAIRRRVTPITWPILSGTQAVRALQRLGFFIDRPRGSHAVLKKVTPQVERGCVIPMHREVALGTLRSALKMAGVSPEEFTEAL